MRLLLPLLAVIAALTGCGDDGAAGDRPLVVATTAHVADIVRQSAGDEIEVRGLIPAGADPHAHELRTSDVDALIEAALVVRSGGDLDDWLEEAIDASGTDAPVIALLDTVDPLHGGGHEDEHAAGDEDVDPHWWQDPGNGVLATEALRDAIVEVLPDRRAQVEAASREYVERLRRLDAAVERCVDEIPADRRTLVTTHDSLGYFARRYGFEVIGAVIPSLSSQSQPSAGETAALIRAIREHGVRAIFTENALNAQLEQTVADEAGARVGDPLYADTLGEPGTPAGSYIGSIAVNTRAIVEGLTGREASCELLS